MVAAEHPRRGLIRLLDTQRLLLRYRDARKTKILLARGGYRSGKTVGLVAKALDLAIRCYPDPILVMEPTFPMVIGVFVDTAMKWLTEWGYKPHWSISKKTLTVKVKGRVCRMLCRSADSRRSIEGLTVGALIADEWELYNVEILKTAMARVSVGKPENQQIVLAGTPEGYGPGYELIEKNKDPRTRVIVMRTADNRYLRKDYVEDMRKRFSEEEAIEKIDGERTAPSGRTYTRFSRDVHCSGVPAVRDGRLQFFAGFDTSKMVWVAVMVDRDNRRFHVVGEIVSASGDSMAQARRAREFVIDLERERGRNIGHEDVRHMAIPVVCDANVIGVSTTGGVALSHVKILQDAGFKPLYSRKNARYEDRKASLQKLLADRMITFDAHAAEYTVRCVEHTKAKDGRADTRSGLMQGELALTSGIMWHAPAFAPGPREVRHEELWGRARGPAKTRADALAQLPRALESRIIGASPGGRAGHPVADLGCTIPEFCEHIERLWTAGMSWESWTQSGWHLDHIRPLASFDLKDRAQFLAAAHFTNYQPLWAADNLKKGGKWSGG